MKPKQLMHTLVDLDKKAQELDKALKNVRVGIHDVLWDLIELRKGKLKAEQKKTTE